MFGKLSGHTTQPAEDEAQTFVSLRTELRGLLIDPTRTDIERALAEWRWLKPPEDPPLIVSAFGDMFFHQAGTILMLDTLEGSLTRVASSGGEFKDRLATRDGRDELLSDVWVQAAQRRGLTLNDGECFDWAVPPALGGPFSADNITKMSFVGKVDLAGQLHRQIKSLPPGTKINRVSIEGA